MADEPNKRMDETLKAYAEKRRQEAGPALELHPATRQMFQAEVARTYKQVPQRSWLQRMITFWPRIAFAATCLAITLTLVVFVLPERRLTEMAQTKTAEESESLLRDSRLVDKEKADNYRFADAPAAPAPSTAPVVPPSGSVDQLALKNEADEVKAKSESVAELRKDNNDNSVRLMREEAANKPAARRSYANVTGDSSAAGRYRQPEQRTRETQLGAQVQVAPPILNTFELEQVGNVVRLYDEDGSVYSGTVVLNDEAKKQRLYSVPQKPAAQSGAAGPTAAEQQVFFRAAGTNLRLNQQVSIEANILTVTNSLPGLAPTDGVRQQQRALTPQQTIQGRAQVGSNQQVIINAVPAQP